MHRVPEAWYAGQNALQHSERQSRSTFISNGVTLTFSTYSLHPEMYIRTREGYVFIAFTHRMQTQ